MKFYHFHIIGTELPFVCVPLRCGDKGMGVIGIDSFRDVPIAPYESHPEPDLVKFIEKLGSMLGIFTRICHDLTRTCHDLTRTCHNITRTCHNLTRTCHNLTRTCHNLTRTCHNLIRTCHNLTRTCHNLTRTCHNLTRTCHNLLGSTIDSQRKKGTLKVQFFPVK